MTCPPLENAAQPKHVQELLRAVMKTQMCAAAQRAARTKTIPRPMRFHDVRPRR